MESAGIVVARRIRLELEDLNETRDVIVERWREYNRNSHPAFLDSVALNLHSWYSGFERLFEVIAADVDRSEPSGPSWHHDLLRQMTLEITSIRPAVLPRDVADELDEFLRFRHVVRNHYARTLDPRRIAIFIEDLAAVHEQAKAALLRFAQFAEMI